MSIQTAPDVYTTMSRGHLSGFVEGGHLVKVKEEVLREAKEKAAAMEAVRGPSNHKGKRINENH